MNSEDKKLNLKEEIKNFLYHCEFAQNKSANTIKSFRIDLYRFEEYIEGCKNIKTLDDIDIINFKEFLIELQNDKVGKRSLNRKISSLRTFFKYLKSMGKIKENIAQLIVFPNFNKEIPDVLTKEEIDSLRKAIKLKNYHSLRDRAMLELLYSSGITSQELLALGENVFNFERREVIVTGYKQSRVVYFSERAKEYLLRYIEAKKDKLGDRYRSEILFVNGSAQRLSDRSLRRLIDRYAVIAGIEREISPYSFRHTFAVHMLEHGMTLLELKELLGHVNLESTRVYEDALNKKKRKEMLK